MRISPFQVALTITLLAGIAFFLTRRPRTSPTKPIRLPDIQLGPIRHQALSDALEARVRKFEPIFAEVYPNTHKAWLDGFMRDADPEPEVAIWEAMASAYKGFTERRSLSLEAKKEAFGLLLARSAGDEQHTLSGAKLRHLTLAEAEEVLSLYPAAPQPVLYEKK
jgi:hypothetical protein